MNKQIFLKNEISLQENFERNISTSSAQLAAAKKMAQKWLNFTAAPLNFSES